MFDIELREETHKTFRVFPISVANKFAKYEEFRTGIHV